jgi:hypothetical protein
MRSTKRVALPLTFEHAARSPDTLGLAALSLAARRGRRTR